MDYCAPHSATTLPPPSSLIGMIEVFEKSWKRDQDFLVKMVVGYIHVGGLSIERGETSIVFHLLMYRF